MSVSSLRARLIVVVVVVVVVFLFSCSLFGFILFFVRVVVVVDVVVVVVDVVVVVVVVDVVVVVVVVVDVDVDVVVVVVVFLGCLWLLAICFLAVSFLLPAFLLLVTCYCCGCLPRLLAFCCLPFAACCLLGLVGWVVRTGSATRAAAPSPWRPSNRHGADGRHRDSSLRQAPGVALDEFGSAQGCLVTQEPEAPGGAVTVKCTASLQACGAARDLLAGLEDV